MKRFVSLVALVVVMSVFASVANADSDSWKRAILNGALTAIVNRPTAKNVALAGDDMALKVRSEYRTNSDPMLDAVVSSIAQAKKMADVPKILVVDQRDEASKAVLNAFCVPGTQGGHIFVTEGLIEFFKSKDPLGWQDDVAGVVGHECGHIQNGDSKKAWSDALASNVLLSTILGGTEANQTIQVAAGVLSMVRSAKYSRTQELQADQFGLESLAVTGRDPKAMARSLKLLSESEGEISKLGEIAADHPRFVDRIGHLDKRLTENPPEINLPAPPTVSIDPSVIPAQAGIQSNSATALQKPAIPEVRLVLVINQMEGREFTGGAAELAGWINDGLKGSGITIVARDERYDRARAEQELEGVDPATRPEYDKYFGATGEITVNASCVDGYSESGIAGGIERIETAGSRRVRKFYARVTGTVSATSYRELAVEPVSATGYSEEVVSGSETNVRIPGVEVSIGTGGDFEQVTTDKAWRFWAASAADGLKKAYSRLPKQVPVAAKTDSFVLLRGVRNAQIGQVLAVYSNRDSSLESGSLGRLIGRVKVVAFNQNATVASQYGVSPEIGGQNYPIGKYAYWSGTATDVAAGMIFIPIKDVAE